MRLFWELTQRSLQRHLTYRAAVIAGLVTNFFFGLMRAAIVVALYGEQTNVAGYSLQGAITYTGLTQAMIAYLGIFGWYELMRSVHSGEIASDLLKPLNIFHFWLARDLGRAVVNLVLRGVVIMLLYALIFELVTPQSWAQWLAVSMSLFLSWLVCFCFAFVVNLAAFWTPNASGIGRFWFFSALFFSGFMMPLAFFPAWVQTVANLTPFPHMLNTSVEIYLGILTGPAVMPALALQLFWVMVLSLLGQLVLRLGVRRLVILGG
jgi:ABC-2 type transport system permease protein